MKFYPLNPAACFTVSGAAASLNDAASTLRFHASGDSPRTVEAQHEKMTQAYRQAEQALDMIRDVLTGNGVAL